MYYPKAHYCRKEVGDYLNLYIFPNTVVFVCALIGFGYGIRKLVRGKKAVFPKMVTGAVGCIALGRMYQLVKMATGGRVEGEFQLGILGVLGCMMFFFSANFGLMDRTINPASIVGNEAGELHRKVEMVAPASMLAADNLNLFSGKSFGQIFESEKVKEAFSFAGCGSRHNKMS